MGLGGAFASSGSMISVLSLFVFVLLTKASLDLVIDMSVDCCHNRTSSILSSDGGEDDVVSRGDDDREHDNDDDDDDDDDDHHRHGIDAVSGLEGCMRCDGDYLEKRGEVEGADNVKEDEPDDAPPTIDNEGIIAAKRDDDVEGEGGSKREEEEVEEMMAGSTPLMARDEGKDHDDDVGNALRSPTKTMGLFFDHPLASSAPQPNDNIDRYDSFTMDLPPEIYRQFPPQEEEHPSSTSRAQGLQGAAHAGTVARR